VLSSPPVGESERPATIWVLDEDGGPATLERLGDARSLADATGAAVGVVAVAPVGHPTETLAAHGADRIVHAVTPTGDPPSLATRVETARETLAADPPRIVLAGGDVRGREWAAALAVRAGWSLVSPALAATVRAGRIEVTALGAGGLARRVRVEAGTSTILTLAPGVGEAHPAMPGRAAEVLRRAASAHPDPVRARRVVPADPATVDIRDARRLVAGGRGLGGRAGFDALRRLAARLGAGVAASRVAVDLGWIEAERQVGQTGKTVAPDLYVACGISGASHHLEGMSGARAVVAINTDPRAPIFRVAHLGLVADLHAVLRETEAELVALEPR
jgi:electron transfer flavoprotein alpha subunit